MTSILMNFDDFNFEDFNFDDFNFDDFNFDYINFVDSNFDDFNFDDNNIDDFNFDCFVPSKRQKENIQPITTKTASSQNMIATIAHCRILYESGSNW